MPGPHKDHKHHKPPKPHEDSKKVRLLIGEHENPAANDPGRFSAEWVEFEGRKVASFKNDGISYKAYECASYEFPAYRVYVSDEKNPSLPKYSLRPYSRSGEHPRDYAQPFTREELVSAYPMFARKLGDFPTRQIDPHEI